MNLQARPILARLDGVLVSTDWETRFSLTSLFSLPHPTSNHTSMCLDSNESMEAKRRIFWFEKMWLEAPSCEAVVKESWEIPISSLHQDVNEILAGKIRHLRKIIRMWEKCCFGSIKNKKKEITEEIYILGTLQEVKELSQEELAYLQSLRVIVQNIYKKEEIIWIQRARVN